MSTSEVVTLSAVCDACATTLQRVPRMTVERVGGWAALRLEWWQFSQRVCGHNNAGVRFVMQFEAPKEPNAATKGVGLVRSLSVPESRGVCSACNHPMDGYRCPNEFCITNEGKRR